VGSNFFVLFFFFFLFSGISPGILTQTSYDRRTSLTVSLFVACKTKVTFNMNGKNKKKKKERKKEEKKIREVSAPL
jgi:hypothetical protein